LYFCNRLVMTVCHAGALAKYDIENGRAMPGRIPFDVAVAHAYTASTFYTPGILGIASLPFGALLMLQIVVKVLALISGDARLAYNCAPLIAHQT
jgi:hypothetical protein